MRMLKGLPSKAAREIERSRKEAQSMHMDAHAIAPRRPKSRVPQLLLRFLRPILIHTPRSRQSYREAVLCVLLTGFKSVVP